MVVKKNRNEPGRILVDPSIFGELKISKRDPVGARRCRCWSELLLSWVVAGCSCVSHRLLLIFAPGGCPELLAAAGVVCLARHCYPVLLAAAGCVGGCWSCCCCRCLGAARVRRKKERAALACCSEQRHCCCPPEKGTEAASACWSSRCCSFAGEKEREKREEGRRLERKGRRRVKNDLGFWSLD